MIDIEVMDAGDLVHAMLVAFDPRLVSRDADGNHDDRDGAWLQSQLYFDAHERLNELLPASTQVEAA